MNIMLDLNMQYSLSPSTSPESKKTAAQSPGFVIQPQRPAHWAEGQRPLRSPFEYARYIRRGGTGNIQTKRSCVFKCRYCTYPLLEGTRFRAREAVDTVDEIESLQREYGPHLAQLQRLGCSVSTNAQDAEDCHAAAAARNDDQAGQQWVG